MSEIHFTFETSGADLLALWKNAWDIAFEFAGEALQVSSFDYFDVRLSDVTSGDGRTKVAHYEASVRVAIPVTVAQPALKF